MRKEPMPLGVLKDREEHYSGIREPDRPSCGGKQTKRPDQKRQCGMIEAFLRKVSSRYSPEEGDAPKPNCRMTKIFDPFVG